MRSFIFNYKPCYNCDKLVYLETENNNLINHECFFVYERDKDKVPSDCPLVINREQILRDKINNLKNENESYEHMIKNNEKTIELLIEKLKEL